VILSLSQDSFIIETRVWSLKLSAWNLLAGPATWHGIIQRLISMDGCLLWNVLFSLINERSFFAENSFIIKTSVRSLELSAWDLLSRPSCWNSVVWTLVSMDGCLLWNIVLFRGYE
jgi:hypothetical protein